MPNRRSTFRRTLLLAAMMAMAVVGSPGPVSAADLPLVIGPPTVSVYALDTALVEMPVSIPTSETQSFQLVMTLTRGDGTLVREAITRTLALAPGQAEWMRFTIPHSPFAETVVVRAV